MTQREAVYMAVHTVFGELDTIPETGHWSDSQKKEVLGLMMQSFKAGEWTKNSGGQDDASLLKYIPGLVNNHVRKDKRLNGGVEYVAKNPGSRAGTGVEPAEQKAMRMLLATLRRRRCHHGWCRARRAIPAEIEKRLAEINRKVEINVDALPESLRHLVPQS